MRTPDPATQKRLIEVRNRILKAMQNELARGDITKDQLLAIMAHATGACIAFQDQRTVTPAQALELVAKNIEAGNREAMAEVKSADGRPS